MEKQDGKVYEVLPNGNKYRVLTQSISINGGGAFEPLSEDTSVIIHNCKILQDSEGNNLGSGFEKCNKRLNINLKELFEMDMSNWESFALAWANKMVPWEGDVIDGDESDLI